MQQPARWWDSVIGLIGPVGGFGGGNTGNGPDGIPQPGRPVAGSPANADYHEAEYVFDADSVAAIGQDVLDAIRQKALSGDPNVRNTLRQAIGVPQKPGFYSGGTTSLAAVPIVKPITPPVRPQPVQLPPQQQQPQGAGPAPAGGGATGANTAANPPQIPQNINNFTGGTVNRAVDSVASSVPTMVPNSVIKQPAAPAAQPIQVGPRISESSIVPIGAMPKQPQAPAPIGQPIDVAIGVPSQQPVQQMQPRQDVPQPAAPGAMPDGAGYQAAMKDAATNFDAWYGKLTPIQRARVDAQGKDKALAQFQNWYMNRQNGVEGGAAEFTPTSLQGWTPGPQDYIGQGLDMSHKIASGDSPYQRTIANQARQSTGAALAEANAALRNEAGSAGVQGAGLASLYGVANRNAGAQVAKMEGEIAKSQSNEMTQAALGLAAQGIAAQTAADRHAAEQLGLTNDAYALAGNLIANGGTLDDVNAALKNSGVQINQGQYDGIKNKQVTDSKQGVQADPSKYIGTFMSGGGGLDRLLSDPSMVATARANLPPGASEQQIGDWIRMQHGAYLSENKAAGTNNLSSLLSHFKTTGKDSNFAKLDNSTRMNAALSLGLDPSDPKNQPAIDAEIDRSWQQAIKPTVTRIAENLVAEKFVSQDNLDEMGGSAGLEQFILDMISDNVIDPATGQPLEGKSIVWPWNNPSTFYKYEDWNGKDVDPSVDNSATVLKVDGKDYVDGTGAPVTFAQVQEKWSQLSDSTRSKYYVNGRFDSAKFAKEQMTAKGEGDSALPQPDDLFDSMSPEYQEQVGEFIGGSGGPAPAKIDINGNPTDAADGVSDPNSFVYYDDTGKAQVGSRELDLARIYMQFSIAKNNGVPMTSGQFMNLWKDGKAWHVDADGRVMELYGLKPPADTTSYEFKPSTGKTTSLTEKTVNAANAAVGAVLGAPVTGLISSIGGSKPFSETKYTSGAQITGDQLKVWNTPEGYANLVKNNSAVPEDIATAFWNSPTLRRDTAGYDKWRINDTAKSFLAKYTGKIVRAPNGRLYEVLGPGTASNKRNSTQAIMFRDIETNAQVPYSNSTNTKGARMSFPVNLG